MENNIFVVKTAEGHSKTFDYATYKKLQSFLATEINSEEEYVAWVKEWKSLERQMVLASRFFRSQSRLYLRKYTGKDTESGYFEHRSNRLWIRVIARSFYEKRVENKKLLKEKNFFKTEVINMNTKELEGV